MGFTGVGSTFRRWNTTSGAWEDLSQVRNISQGGMSRAMEDDTALDTPGGYRTKKPGFREPGTWSFELNFNREAYDKLKADFESEDAQFYEVMLPIDKDPDNTSWEFEGYVSEIPLTIPEGVVTFNCTITVSGQTNVESGSGTA